MISLARSRHIVSIISVRAVEFPSRSLHRCLHVLGVKVHKHQALVDLRGEGLWQAQDCSESLRGHICRPWLKSPSDCLLFNTPAKASSTCKIQSTLSFADAGLHLAPGSVSNRLGISTKSFSNAKKAILSERAHQTSPSLVQECTGSHSAAKKEHMP